MKKSARPYICTFIIALCTSCSVSKFIPEDKYLLDEVRIVSETKEVKPSLFNSYIRQILMPNGSIWLRYLCVLIASQVWTPLNGLIVFLGRLVMLR